MRRETMLKELEFLELSIEQSFTSADQALKELRALKETILKEEIATLKTVEIEFPKTPVEVRNETGKPITVKLVKTTERFYLDIIDTENNPSELAIQDGYEVATPNYYLQPTVYESKV